VDAQEERWLPARRFAGFYEVSSLGNVYSMPRRGTPGELLDPQVNSAGYRQVALCKYGTVSKVLVGRLVLETFRWPPPRPGARVRRGPGGKLDDSLANLRWG
jgi:NUMOD4 motif